MQMAIRIGNLIRVRDLNGLGEISPVSFKRKIRDLLDDPTSPFFQNLPEKFRDNAEHYQILEHRGRDRAAIAKEMTSGGKLAEFEQEKFLESQFVKKYSDARVFGNTFLKKMEIKVTLRRELFSLA